MANWDLGSGRGATLAALVRNPDRPSEQCRIEPDALGVGFHDIGYRLRWQPPSDHATLI